MRILFVGGGTLGPVTPLLALAEQCKEKKFGEVVGLVGTRNIAEKIMAENAGLNFFSVTAGKWRRYGDWRNLLAPLAVLIGFFESLFLLGRLRPTVIFSGGSFVGVPVIFAAWILRIPTVTHQQDLCPSFANRLMAPLVKKITVTFPESVKFFPKNKTVVTGNPIRASLFAGDTVRAREIFHLETGWPTVFVFGGGTGARDLNQVVIQALPELTKFCQVIHSTGIGKNELSGKQNNPRYHPFELLTKEMADAYAVADLVISRAGIGAISELAALGKAVVLVPLPGHQEENACYLEKKNAARVILQSELTPQNLTRFIEDLIRNQTGLSNLRENVKKISPPDAVQKIVDILIELDDTR